MIRGKVKRKRGEIGDRKNFDEDNAKSREKEKGDEISGFISFNTQRGVLGKK